MTRNCLRHLAATVSILAPTVCILQGVPLAAVMAPLVTPLATVGPQVRRVRLAGVETLLVAFSHPTARGTQRWGGMSGVPYLASTVEPALRSVRRQLLDSLTHRPGAATPAKASPPALPRPTGTARSTAQVAEQARRVVAAEVEARSGSVREVALGRRRELLVTSASGIPARVRVVSRRSGDWQVSIREGDSAGSTSRFWVFVDLGSPSPRFFVVPDADAVNGIRRRHAAYLARNGGRRVHNDDSLHQAIRTRDVQEWAERWDLIGL